MLAAEHETLVEEITRSSSSNPGESPLAPLQVVEERRDQLRHRRRLLQLRRVARLLHDRGAACGAVEAIRFAAAL